MARSLSPIGKAALWLASPFGDPVLRDCCPLRLKYAETVDAVERRYFVAFCQRRIIEYGLDKIIDFSTERQHRLTDMDQFAGPLADDVSAEQLAGLAVEDQF